MRTLYLCGGGNSEGVRLALAIQSATRRWDRLLVLDDDPSKLGRELLGVEIAGGFDLLESVAPEDSEIANLVARTTAKRAAARARIAGHGIPFALLVSPNVDTLGAELARDLIVYQNATIGPEVTIAEGCVVFMGAVVGHESRIGAGCVVASNAVVNARVELGEGVYVGTNATVLPEVKVGAWATIGAGSVVFEDVPPGATAMGVPANTLPVAAEPERDGTHASHLPAAPADAELEPKLRRIWQALLGAPVLRDDANFFDIGGSSLLALRMRDQIERELGRRTELVDLFRFPTLRALALHLGGAANRADGGATRRAALRRELHDRLHGARLAR